MIDLSSAAIIASGVTSAVIGYVWYHPSLFGSAWMRMSNMTPEMAEAGKRRMPFMAILGLLAAMLVAYVMTAVSAAWGFYEWVGALQLGFWCWAGFVAPVLLSTVLFEHKPFRLYLINAAYWLIAMLVMAQMIVFASAPTYDYGIYDTLDANSGYVGE